MFEIRKVVREKLRFMRELLSEVVTMFQVSPDAIGEGGGTRS